MNQCLKRDICAGICYKHIESFALNICCLFRYSLTNVTLQNAESDVVSNLQVPIHGLQKGS